MRNTSFYLIHNNSQDRIVLRERIKYLAKKLNVALFEIYKQKNNLKIYFGLRIKLKTLRIYFLKIFFNLKHKKEFSFNFYYLILISFLNLNKLLFKLIFKNKKAIIKAINHQEIESLVTQKHIKAWEHFLKSKKEIMIIFEDDAMCKNDSKRKLKDFLNKLNNFNMENVFIDLAGGYNIEEIIPKRKIIELKDEFFIVNGLYTNTACSYLVNRNLVKKLYKEYQKSNSNNFFPIDHLINKLGLEINRTHNAKSIHFHNPLFTHGSFEGNIKSWQIY